MSSKSEARVFQVPPASELDWSNELRESPSRSFADQVMVAEGPCSTSPPFGDNTATVGAVTDAVRGIEDVSTARQDDLVSAWPGQHKEERRDGMVGWYLDVEGMTRNLRSELIFESNAVRARRRSWCVLQRGEKWGVKASCSVMPVSIRPLTTMVGRELRFTFACVSRLVKLARATSAPVRLPPKPVKASDDHRSS